MLFFFLSGAELDLTILPEVGIVGVIYVLFRTLGKWLGAWFGAGAVAAAMAPRQRENGTLLPVAIKIRPITYVEGLGD